MKDKKHTMENQYIQEINQGNRDAFRQIMELYEKQVYGFINSVIRKPYIAQDLTQETFLKVYKNLYRYNPSKEFATWVYAITRNVIRDYLRKSERARKKEISGLNHIEDYPDGENVEHKIIIREDYMELCKQIDKLQAKYKDVIILKYFHDLTYKEIAIRLNLSEKKVESWLYLARKKLTKQCNKNNKTGEVKMLWDI